MTNNEKSIDKATVSFLYWIIDEEVEKPESEQNMELIDNCFKAIDHLTGPPDAEMAARIERGKRSLIELAHQMHRQKRSMIAKRVIAAVVICVSILIVGVFAVSASCGLTPVEFLEKLGLGLFNIEKDVTVEMDGLTFVRAGSVIKYNSLNELLETENIDILYPTWLPDGIIVKSVLISERPQYDEVVFKFNEDSINFSVKFFADIDVGAMCDAYMTIDLNGLRIAINNEGSTYFGVFESGGYSYSIRSNTYEILEQFILNLKDN